MDVHEYESRAQMGSLRLEVADLVRGAMRWPFSSFVLQELSPGELSLELQRRTMGVARLRLVPKKSSVRPIVNLGAKSIVNVPVGHPNARPIRQHGRDGIVRTFKPVNSVLRSAQQVIPPTITCSTSPLKSQARCFGMKAGH